MSTLPRSVVEHGRLYDHTPQDHDRPNVTLLYLSLLGRHFTDSRLSSHAVITKLTAVF